MSYINIQFSFLNRKVIRNKLHCCEQKLIHFGPLTPAHSLIFEANSTRLQLIIHIQDSTVRIAALLVIEQGNGSLSVAKADCFSAYSNFKNFEKGGDAEVSEAQPTEDTLLEGQKDEEKSSLQASFFCLSISHV